MSDILPVDIKSWQLVEGIFKQLIDNYGYEEIRMPLLEMTSLFKRSIGELDEDSKRRLTSNPLRILDSKNSDMRDVIEAAPKLAEHLDEESEQHFKALCTILDEHEIKYRINPCLVRGLDYYNRTVFEWVTDQLGAQGTVCAGGRYDGLVKQLGGRDTAAVGFAMGIERLISLLDEDFVARSVQLPDAYFIMLGQEAQNQGYHLAEILRDEIPSLRLHVHAGGGSLKSQMKKADKSQVKLALIVGEDEMSASQVTIKHLRKTGAEQQTIQQSELLSWLQDYLN